MGDELSLNIKLAMESQSFQQQVADINRQMTLVQSGFASASSKLGEFGTATDKLKAKQELLIQQLELAKSKTTLYADAQAKSKTTLDKNVIANEALRVKLEAVTKAHANSVTATGKDSEESKKLALELSQLKTEYSNSNSLIANNAKALDNNTIKMNNAQKASNNLERQLKSTANEITVQESKWTKLGTSLTESSTKLQSVGSSMSATGEKLSTSLTVPIVGAGVAIGKLSLDFEASMAKVSTISDDTQMPIGTLRSAILKLSDDTGIASTEIANNVYDAISAGQSTGDAVNFVTNSTKLAKAGYAEAGDSLDLLTTILNSYGMKSSETAKISDVLIQVQNKGKVTVGELSKSMGMLIPTANQYGISLEQLGAGYAIMTSKGVKSAEATTYMNSAFNEMGKSGTVASKAIESATGKTFPELIKSGKSVGDVLNIMSDYAKKNGKSLTDMFGSVEAGKAGLLLSGNAGKEFDEMLKSMGLSAGETDKAFAKVNDTAGTRLAKSFNELKNAGIKMGDALTPVIEKISVVVQNLANKFNELTPAQQGTIIKIAGLVAVIGPAILIVGKLATAFGAIAGVLGTASTALGIGATATAGVGVAGATASTGLAGLGTAFGAVLIPLAPYILAIGAVVGTGVLIKNAMEKEATPAVDLFADKVVTTANSVNGANNNMGASYSTVVTTISDGTKKAVGSYMDLDTKATASLTDLYVNSDNFSNQAKDVVISKYSEMANKSTILSTDMKTVMVGEFKELVTDTGTLTEQNKTEILAKYTEMVNGTKNLTQKQKDDTIDAFKLTLQKSTEITEEQKNKLVAQYQQMSNQVKTKLDERYKTEYDTMNAFFDKSNALSKSDEEKALAKLKQDNINKKTEEDNYTKQIQAIVKKASDEHRALTLEDQQKINAIQDKMKVTAIKTLSDTDVESKVILERIKEYGVRITTEQASAIIKNANTQRDGVVKGANDTYTKSVEAIIKMRDESHSITADQATKLIADAKKQKDKTIEHAEAMRSGAVAKVISMNSSITKSVDTSTGDILTNWGTLKKWWADWEPGVKTFVTKMVNGVVGGYDKNYTGTNNYKGGLTTMHEHGYELYNLPKASRIYNHEASEALVLQTAKQVALGVLADSNGGKGETTITQNFYVPVASASELVRQSKRGQQELAFNF
ncbi:phage tail tape measure protein [Clostridium estertheticum]|uniref:phage tail tape measure protein n=1 Tax=Clostridium estertheticum TaxID=238834 RepID=UPI001C0D7850|nr:phage tail tape measure protein [Clostridium estertheticum]MBU3216646.1 phage tail tape measure protein [Clostridium estertheticum]WAG54399.1 phage tail tape measure protein [Clostridium estertheticum]